MFLKRKRQNCDYTITACVLKGIIIYILVTYTYLLAMYDRDKMKRVIHYSVIL